jgi:hypothetical protein
MEKSELKDRVDDIANSLRIAMDFAFNENRRILPNTNYGRMYEWLTHAYRMANSLKTKLDDDNVNREQTLSRETIKEIIGRYCVVRGLDNELGYAHKVIDSFK